MTSPAVQIAAGAYVHAAFEEDGEIIVKWGTRSGERWYPCGSLRKDGNSYTAFTYDGGRIGVARDIQAAVAMVRDYNAAHVPGASEQVKEP